jgi:O-antigen/teichoic acid export membrane protein
MSFAVIARDAIAARFAPRFANGLLPPGLRHGIENYCKLMAGTSARLALQALYFFVLANTLSLADMGIFASASAAGLMVASFSGLGFGSFAFRAAAGKPRLLGQYLGLYYGGLLLTTPLGLLAALPFYYWLFADSLSLTAFVAILIVEAVLWRTVEVLSIVQNGLGRFTTGALSITIASGIRAGGAVAFALGGGGGVESWTLFYFVANALALLTVLTALRPPAIPRWRTRLFVARLRDSFLFALSYFALNAQGQIDKIIVLSLADARFAGIYAISSRILDFTALPFRSFYTLYTRKLFGEGKRIKDALRRTLKVEGTILLLTLLGFGALALLLWRWPDMLGGNIAVAAQLFLLMLLVPAFRNLMEFHGELFFVYGRMTARAAIALVLVALNAGALALLLSTTSNTVTIGLMLNVIYGGLYLLSAAALYRFVTGNQKP